MKRHTRSKFGFPHIVGLGAVVLTGLWAYNHYLVPPQPKPQATTSPLAGIQPYFPYIMAGAGLLVVVAFLAYRKRHAGSAPAGSDASAPSKDVRIAVT